MSIKKRLISSKTTFIITLIIATLVITEVWLLGITDHRSIAANATISLSILSISFFLFISIGLFKGLKLKDELGNVMRHYKPSKPPYPGEGAGEVIGQGGVPVDLLGEGPEGCGVFILWLLLSLFLSTILWFFGASFWLLGLTIIAMLYWIFFRALRLIFKNSAKCRGSIKKSPSIALLYTVLYTCWMYGLIFLLPQLK